VSHPGLHHTCDRQPRSLREGHNSSTEGVLEPVWHFAVVSSLLFKFGASGRGFTSLIVVSMAEVENRQV